jgi:hypothetical protein
MSISRSRRILGTCWYSDISTFLGSLIATSGFVFA